VASYLPTQNEESIIERTGLFRALADESLHHYGLSLFIAIKSFKCVTLMDFAWALVWADGWASQTKIWCNLFSHQ